MFDDELVGQEAEILDGLEPVLVPSDLLKHLVLQIVVEDVVVGDAEQIAQELPPRDVRPARMEARMRLHADQTEFNQPENVVRIIRVANGSSKDRSSLANAVMVDVSERVAVRKAFKCETRQKVELFRPFQQSTSGRYLDDLTGSMTKII